jgi:hypothetical protein
MLAALVALAALSIQCSSTRETPDAKKAADQGAPEVKLTEYQPRSMMVTEYHVPLKAKYPVIDVHNHLGSVGGSREAADPAECAREMDASGVAQVRMRQRSSPAPVWNSDIDARI